MRIDRACLFEVDEQLFYLHFNMPRKQTLKKKMSNMRPNKNVRNHDCWCLVIKIFNGYIVHGITLFQNQLLITVSQYLSVTESTMWVDIYQSPNRQLWVSIYQSPNRSNKCLFINDVKWEFKMVASNMI